MTTRSGRRYQDSPPGTPDWYRELENQSLDNIYGHEFFERKYRPTDKTKRHRLEDEEEKDEKVVSYYRRPSHR